MKAASYNQGNSGHRKALCPGAPQGLAWYQHLLYSGYMSRTNRYIQTEYESHLILQSFHTKDNIDTLVSNTR